MKYSGFITVESKTCAGVRFVLKKMSVRRRDRLEELQASIQTKLRPLREELGPLAVEYRAAVEALKAKEARGVAGASLEMEDAKIRRAIELSAAINKIDRGELTPAAVRFVLERIEGLAINGEPATLDALMENGPDELYDEIAGAVAREIGLLPEERENLQSPFTSAAVVDGVAKAGSADLAGTPGMITSEGAPNSTGPVSASVLSTV